MNRFLLIAVSVAVFLGVAFTNQPLTAQIFDEYGIITVLSQNSVNYTTPYRELGSSDSKSPIAWSKFALPPNFIQGTVSGKDDGFFQVSLPFPFEFNGEVYNSVWICVNGYITFTPEGELPPATLPSKNANDVDGTGAPIGTGFKYSDWFFYFNASYPKNIIAPYMGDHFYRFGDDNPNPWPAANQYVPSEISTGQTDLDNDGDYDVFTVQWKNLNINFNDDRNMSPIAGVTSSVGNFQVKLYKSQDEFTDQGDIEFCYGQVNVDNAQTNDTRVNTKGAVIGIKGASGQDGQHADYLNALISIPGFMDEFGEISYDEEILDTYDKELTKSSEKTTTAWQPFGGSDYRLRFLALGRNQKEEFWGDGDANLSQMEGQIHGYPGMGQSIFATVADARAIIRSIVLRQPLPRERRREAYHGDVNHNGRYFFYTDYNYFGWNEGANPGTVRNVYPKDTVFKKEITWKNMKYADSLTYIIHDEYYFENVGDPLPNSIPRKVVIPSQISSLSEIYFQVTELDAALILHYISGRLPRLPFLLDSFSLKGKLIPTNAIASGIQLGNVNEISKNTYKIPVYLNGSFDGPLAIRARVNGKITNVTGFNDALVSFNEDLLVIAGTAEYTNDSPICMLTVEVEDTKLNVSDLRFNDNELSSISLNLASVENTNNEVLMFQNTPNPFTDKTVITLNLPDNGNYNLTIYNSMGNAVKTFNNIKSDVIEWNGTDENGTPVSNGAYIYKLNGSDASITKSMILSR